MPYSPVGLLFRHCFALPEAKRFLQRLVGPAVLGVCAIESDCEFNPRSKLAQKVLNGLDWAPLIEKCRQLVESLTCTLPEHVPLCIRKAAFGAYESTKGGDRVEGMVAVASLLVGRCVADSLVAVFEGFGDCDDCTGVLRKLKVCRAILRSVAEAELNKELLELADEYNVPASTLEMINSLIDVSGRSVQKFCARIVDRSSMTAALKRNKERLNTVESQENRLTQLIAVQDFCQKHSLTSHYPLAVNDSTSEPHASTESPISSEGMEPTEIGDADHMEEEEEAVSPSPVPSTVGMEQIDYNFDQEESEDDEENHTLPPEEIPENIGHLPLTALDGSRVQLDDILSLGDLVLVVLLRQFGCNMCRRTAAELAQNFDNFAHLGIKLVAVGNGSTDAATKFAADVNFRGKLFVDPTLSVYKALNCHRGSWRTVLFNGTTFKKFFSALSAGYRPKELQGDQLQLGGAFLVRRQRQIVYAMCEEFAGDVDVGEIVRVSEMLGGRAPVAS